MYSHEVMSSIAEYAQTQAKVQKAAGLEENIDWNACVAAGTANNPACAAYADVLAAYVRRFGGGHGAPIIKMLDAFAKKHQEM